MSATPTATVSPPAPAPRTGDLRDVGAVRRDALRAHTWTSTGATKVLGDAEVDEATLSGLTSIRGSLTGGQVTVSGTCDVGGAVRLTRAFRAAGTTTIGHGLEAAEVDLAGAASVTGDLRASGRIRWKGSLEASQEVAAEQIEFDGRAAVDGAVVARELVAKIRGPSRIGSIRADAVRIVRAARLFGSAELEVLSIEGKEIEIEGVHAEYVKGEKVALGPGCRIARVDGTITRRHAGAQVGPASQSPRPYGLSR